ncbi:MAG: glycogen/starch synthase [Prevotella sp.]|jgi:Glycogen synthase|nr:glycogen/starch synthase [Prevotella sp.]MBR4924395.1 glycogen/starch synthase [Prevotella sp.]
MKAKKVLFINQEITPYVPESELSLLGRKVPQLVEGKGYEIRTFMPKWGTINERRGQLHEVQRLSRMMLIINETDHPLIIKVASIPQTRIQVYFIDNDDYFSKRQMEIDELGEEYNDNGERAVFFARGVLETVAKKLRWAPDIIHCQGWMGGVIPFYIKTAYREEPSFANTKVITSLFSKELTSDFGDDFKKCVEYREATPELLEKYNERFDYTELAKMAIDYSDGIICAGNEVNPELLKYAEEKNVPVMPYMEEATGDDYSNFYDLVYGDDNE